MASYIPTQESLLLAWAQNLSTVISGAPTDYGETIESAAAYAAVVTDFTGAYIVANDPATRTKSAIADKNTAKKAMISASRKLVQTLQNWPEMTDAKRALLQIPVRDNEPTPVPVPTVMPVLRVAAVNGRVVDLELRRQDGTTKQKPVGVRAAWLYSYVGDTPPMELTAWEFKGGTTKHNPQIVFPESVAAGTPVWVTALWVNPTDQPGPACAPIKTHISYQGLSEAA